MTVVISGPLVSMFIDMDIAIPIMLVASVILVIATFIDINIGLIAILLSMLLSPEMEAGASAGRSIVIRAEDILLIMVSFTWLAKMAVKKSPLIKPSPLNAPIGIFVTILLLSTLKGMVIGKVIPLKGFFYVLKLTEYYILYFIVLNQTTTVKQVKIFLATLIIVCLIVGIYGNTHMGGEAGRVSAPFEGRGEPNTLGGYLLFVMSVIGGIMFYYKKRKKLLLLILAFLVPTFILIVSRASYLGLIASAGAAFLITKDRRVLLAIIGGVMAVALLLSIGPPVIRDRIFGAFDPEENQELKQVGALRLGPSPAARVVSWKSVLTKKFPRHPFFGQGVTGAGFLDSQYFLTLAETGIIGLIAWVWLMVRVWRCGIYSFHNVETPLFKGICAGYLVGFVGLLFHAIGSNTFIIIRIAEPFWFLTAIVVKLVDIETGKAAMEELIVR